jgi:hypothetical protein
MPQTADAPFDVFPRQWTAQWVVLAGDHPATNRRTAFRATLQMGAVTGSQGNVLHISACDRYFLSINGQWVGEGPPLSPGWAYYYDTHKVDGYLREGTNEIHVIVHSLGEPKPACPLLLAELCDCEGKVLLASGPDWQALRPAAWATDTHHFAMNILSPYQEHVDAREPGSLFGTDAMPTAWSPAQVVRANVKGAPQYAGWVSALAPRDIPFLDYGYTLPSSIVAVEESMELAQRARKGDVSVALSTPGRPLRYCRIDHPERLLQAAAGPVHCRRHCLTAMAAAAAKPPAIAPA